MQENKEKGKKKWSRRKKEVSSKIRKEASKKIVKKINKVEDIIEEWI